MQVHQQSQTAPELALTRVAGGMKTHAKPCTLRMHGLIREKWWDLRGFFDGLLRGQFCAFIHVILVLCRCEFLTIIIPRSRIRPESDGR